MRRIRTTSPSPRKPPTIGTDRLTAPELTARLRGDGLTPPEAHEVYRELRAVGAATWDPDPGVWFVPHYRHVYDISADHRRFSSRAGILPLEIGIEYDSPPTMMHTDPPLHTTYRSRLARSFRPSRVRSLRDSLARRVDAAVDQLRAGEPVDVVEALSAPVPLMVIADLLGIDASDWPRFFLWSEATIPDATDWTPERRAELMAEMDAHLRAVATERRTDPRVDLISDLVADGELSDDEVMMFLNQLLVAGNETTRNLLTGSIVALAERPDQWDLLRNDAADWSGAIDELLRWTSPVVGFMRTATETTTLDDVVIEAGEHVQMLYGSANRDEAHFGHDADTLDVTRRSKGHLAFGFGAHYCVGAALARMEAELVLGALTSRFGGVELVEPPVWSTSTIISGVRAARVRFVGAT